MEKTPIKANSITIILNKNVKILFILLYLMFLYSILFYCMIEYFLE